jgi:hypothetical protein
MNYLEKRVARLLEEMGLHYRAHFAPGGGVAPVDFFIRTLPCLTDCKLLRPGRLSQNLAFNKMATP